MKVNIPELEARVDKGLIKKFTDGKYVGWCYTQKCQFEKAWDEYTCIARGIVTLEDGTVISKPFPKFFNLGDPDTGDIPWDEPIEVMEKIDGSLIIVSFHKGDMIVNSKGSFTSEHADFARKWIAENMAEWAESCKHYSKSDLSAWTYCFEAVFPEKDNCKVIRYGDRADLTLLAIFETYDGRDFSYDELIKMKEVMNNVAVTPRYDFDDINAIIAKCRARSIAEGEGLVIRFAKSGKRIKVKSEEYLRLNRLMSHTSRKHILESLEKGDDVESIYAQLPDELFQEVKSVITDITAEFNLIYINAEIATNMLKETMPTRKEQAIYINTTPELSEIKSVIFAMLNDKNYKKPIWNIIRNRAPAEPEAISEDEE